ncbi:unnamed protein product [Mytilus edulis]|uniref:Vwde helical domain-containing protein n=1 Tax=Mytilus edulis TaxID=6550 RepID=A0A8S3VFN3_MYTED|nr:unnamed protein product [Mytilus edulis]
MGTLSLILVFNLKRQEPCETPNVIDNWKRSAANNLTDNTFLCDSRLEEGWYRITSTAGERMPTECLIGGYRCGTAYPIYLSRKVYPSIRFTSTISVDMHIENVIHESRNYTQETPKFLCRVNDATDDYAYDINFYINNVLITGAIYTNVSNTSIETAVLLQKHWEETFKPNMMVVDGVNGIHVDENQPISVEIKSTLPIGCVYQKGINLHRSKSECFVGLYNGVPKYQKTVNDDFDCSYETFVQSKLEFAEQDCRLTIPHIGWSSSYFINVTGVSDGIVNKVDRIVFLRLYTTTDHASKKIIYIRDKDITHINNICYSSNDPYLKTFDKSEWNITSPNDYGEYVLYKHERLPQQVNVYFSHCMHRVGLCNCGVAVRSADSIFIANFCETGILSKRKTNRYITSRICDDQNLVVTEDTDTKFKVSYIVNIAKRSLEEEDEAPPMYDMMDDEQMEVDEVNIFFYYTDIIQNFQPAVWRNGLTEEIARQKCENAFNMLPAFEICKAYVPTVQSVNYIDQCVSDMKVGENSSYSVETESFTNPGTYSSSFLMYCYLPESRKTRSVAEEYVASGYFISVSNNGHEFTEELTVIIFDARCYTCNSTTFKCNDVDTCPANKKYKTSDTSEYFGIGFGIALAAAGFIVLIIVIAIWKKRFIFRKYDLSNTGQQNPHAQYETVSSISISNYHEYSSILASSESLTRDSSSLGLENPQYENLP